MLESSRLGKLHREYLSPKEDVTFSTTHSLCSCSIQNKLVEHTNRLDNIETKMSELLLNKQPQSEQSSQGVKYSEVMSRSNVNKHSTNSQKNTPSVVVYSPSTPVRTIASAQSPSRSSITSTPSLMSAQTHFSSASSSDFDFSEIAAESIPRDAMNLN